MNREQRRDLKKKGVTEGTMDRLGMLNSPCTIAEALQISRSSAEDAIADYQRHASTIQVAVSIQVEILKELVIKSGLITEDEFKKLYLQKAQEFQKMQREYNEQVDSEEDGPEVSTSMATNVTEIDIQKFEGNEK